MLSVNSRAWIRSFSQHIALIVVSFLATALAVAARAQTLPDVKAQIVSPRHSQIRVLVELEGPPAARVYRASLDASKAINLTSARPAAATAARSQISKNQAQHQDFRATLAQSAIAAEPLYQVTKAFNGIAYRVDQASLPALRALKGVKAVHLIKPEYPTLSTSVPFLGTPSAWAGASPLGATGLGVRIGIIDTGVDYQHPAFGGSGALSDYQANNRTVAPDAYFPSTRVVGGTDLVGDAYDGSNLPVPDPDPMDCDGHGTHVASIAAGGGVKSDGTAFTGPYDGSTPFSSLRIGPGIAPQASIYAIRVFGCSGSTEMTVQAIDWALDPNGDGDLSDHLDVINISLGSSYGTLSDTSAIAADNAARMGIVVVVSAGNSGDTYFIGSSPGSGQRVMSVAAINDSGIPSPQFRINSPAAIAGSFVIGSSSMADAAGSQTPAPSGQTADVALAAPIDACSALTNPGSIAGKIAYIDRGTCTFATKYNNAVTAGAIGVLMGNNVAGSPVGMSGTVIRATLPVVMISQTEGTKIKDQIGATSTVNVTLLSLADSGSLGDVIADFSSRGPAGANGIGGVKPDIAAPGVNILAAQSGVDSANTYAPDGKALLLSGTSMAAPHAAGVMALLVQRFPLRSVEALKAMAMNTSLHDIYLSAGSLERIGADLAGAGRVDPVKALQGTVVAYSNEVAGAVSLSFSGEVEGSSNQTKKLRVQNFGGSAQTFELAMDTVLAAPGVSFSFPGGSSVTVAAGASMLVDVQVSANAAQMNHTRDPSAAELQTAPSPFTSLGSPPRHYLTSASGFINFLQSGATLLRVPVYAALRPASDMHATSSILTGGNATGNTTIALSGSDVCTGTRGAGPSCSGSFPVTDVSRVSAFELQANAKVKPALTPSANIRHVGVAYDAARDLILFGISTWGDWGSPTETAFNILIDSDSNGTYDRILFNSNPGSIASDVLGYSADGQDVFVSAILDRSTDDVSIVGYVNRLSAAQANSALFGSNVMVLAATPAQLGMAVGTKNFKYKVQSCPGSFPDCGHYSEQFIDELPGPFSWSYAAQGLNFNGSHMAQDLSGATLPVAWNNTNMRANGSLGALLLHHHNKSDKRAEVVLVNSPSSYTISTVIIPAAGGTVTCTPNPVNHGGTSTCIATPNAGYTFANWSGDCTGASCTLNNISSNSSVTANFTTPSANYSLSLTKPGTGLGTVIGSPSGINCGSTCAAIYAGGTSVTLTATPNTGSTFNNWGGSCSGSGTCSVVMDTARSVSASFASIPVNNPGVLSFSSARQTVMENAGNAVLTVSRTGGSYGAASVYYNSTAGSATPGVDFASTSGSLSWTNGDAGSRSIIIPIINNTVRNTTARSFTVSLYGASGSTLGSPSSIVVNIQDDDGGSTPWLDLLLLGN